MFGPKTKKTLYESWPEVSEVVTYESGQTLANLRTILKLARMRVDVLAAIFSGRPIFRLHKLMFLLLPARARLVFNEHRGCWYLRRTPRGLLNLLRTPSLSTDYLPRRILRKILKALLFFSPLSVFGALAPFGQFEEGRVEAFGGFQTEHIRRV